MVKIIRTFDLLFELIIHINDYKIILTYIGYNPDKTINNSVSSSLKKVIFHLSI